ncbi:unnamed protein product [Trichobilharzia szidati]|nr:unnamed protein product [Trichobilharzia szidati]
MIYLTLIARVADGLPLAATIQEDDKLSREVFQYQNQAKALDVQRIMVQNIDDVLQRGEALSTLDARASNLSSMSKKYRQDASALNLQSAYVKYVLFCILLLAVFTYFYIRFL